MSEGGQTLQSFEPSFSWNAFKLCPRLTLIDGVLASPYKIWPTMPQQLCRQKGFSTNPVSQCLMVMQLFKELSLACIGIHERYGPCPTSVDRVLALPYKI